MFEDPDPSLLLTRAHIISISCYHLGNSHKVLIKLDT